MRLGGHATREQLLACLGAQRREPAPSGTAAAPSTAAQRLAREAGQVAQSPGAQHGDQAGQAEQAPAERDRARRQGAVRMDEVDLGPAPRAR